ncbi:hypothetical protein PV325_013518 [Microctonus aethiopoides]|uniref:CHHC U11-48K-type domain-containing protein n=1 Tax=Microctonus aethiopoides TaxID=144406 RepID=A0AA39FJT5_9HYME|nr:hypothetical protein PV325_013518 [Microctonus aethiopoides]KAK0094887.1 hypothetical protein PV326_009684 [Microctonus aethiopoides]KAK0170750.1 hypothetical protein PV328_008556 [Microctonus aethiopoides]
MEGYERESEATICPYDKNHIIHKSRIQRHLTKCSRNFPPNYLDTCPFNATHLMIAAEMASHIEQCPDRKYIDSERYFVEMKNHGSLKLCPPSKAELCDDIYSDIWADSEQSINDFKSNASIISDSSTILPRTDKLDRRPYGYSEAMMLEVNDLSHTEDVESVTSSMGRGKYLLKPKKNTRKVGKGRGGYVSGEMIKVGTSATTDVEDLESVTSSIGRGGTNY